MVKKERDGLWFLLHVRYIIYTSIVKENAIP